MAIGTALEEQKRDITLNRAVIYRALAQCFSYPNMELLDSFTNHKMDVDLESWCCFGLDASDGIARIIAWLTQFSEREVALEELGRDYTRLFINASPKMLAPPYGSVYLDKHYRIWGQSTSDVVKLYQMAGLGISESFCDLPDHIVAELEFASYLIAEQQRYHEDSPTSTQNLAAIEKEFLTKHLFKWAPAFFGLVIDNSRTVFYRETALLAKEFIDWDTKRILKSA